MLVGGAVRDALLGRPVADLDVAVPAGALALAERVGAGLGATAVVLDAERGAARVAGPGLQLDFTDFRAADLAGDLAARDFTVNALGVPLAALLAAGRAPASWIRRAAWADLRARRLRPAGPGVLADDPLRVLRAVRLEATLGLRLTPAAARAVRAAAPGLARVAAERVRDELVALLACPPPAARSGARTASACWRWCCPRSRRCGARPSRRRIASACSSTRCVRSRPPIACSAQLDALAPFGEELAAHVAEGLGGALDRAACAEAGRAAARRRPSPRRGGWWAAACGSSSTT